MLFMLRNVTTQFNLSLKDIEISKESVTFIKGRSGIGKSTLLKLLNRTESPKSGEIYYKGESIRKNSPILIRKEVLLVGQISYLILGSIRENFIYYRKIRNEKLLSELEMKKFLELCCITLSLDSLTQNLSGGEKHRVYLAIFISFIPKTLLLDEPTAALDESTGKMLMEKLIRFCKEENCKLIIVSHEKNLAETYGEEIIEMEERCTE